MISIKLSPTRIVLSVVIYCIFFFVDSVHSSTCPPPQLSYPGGDGFALIPGPNATGYSTFHKHSPAELVMFDLVSGYRIGVHQMLQSYNTSTGNNLHGIQIVSDRFYLYPVSTTDSFGVIDSWGIGCFDLVLMTDCSPNGGYTVLGPQPAFSPPVLTFFTGIYGLVPYANKLYSVDQDNFLYCYDPSSLSVCAGWTPYSLTTLLFPWVPALDNSQYTLDILPNTSRLYILRNDALGAFQLRCIDLSLSPSGDMSCAGFLLPAVFENLYILGNKAFMLYFLQEPSLNTWYVCSSSYQGAQGCVDAFTGITIVDVGLFGTYAGVPAALANSFNSTTSLFTLFQGIGSYGCTGKYRAGNKTYFSGIGRNGVICWDDSTNDFCLNATGQYFAGNSSFPGLLYSGLETRDYEVTYDALSDCFFSLGDTDQPWSFDANGNIPCQSKNGVYSIQLQSDYLEIPQNGSASLNITANDYPLGRINQASVQQLLYFSNYSSFTSFTDSFGNVIFNFTSQPGTCGNYSFSYSACGLASTDSVNSTIHINCPPSAVPDTMYFYPGTSSSLDVTANDTDPDLPNDFLTVASIPTLPQYGTATISSNGKTISYTPFPGSFQADSLSYIVQDKFNQTSSPASVTILPLIPILNLSLLNGTVLQSGSVQLFSAPIGGSGSSTFLLSNNGLMGLIISSISFPNGFSSTLSLPLALAPGQSTPITVAFSPSQGGLTSGPITIFSNDPQVGSFVINANGQANGPMLNVTNNGSSVSNGQSVTISGSLGVSGQTQTFQLQNSGNQNLTLTSASISGAGYSLSSPFVPQTLTAGQSTNVSVLLNSTVAGSYPGILTLISNDINSPAFSINLNGLLSGPALSLTENQLPVANGGLVSLSASSFSASSINQNVSITNTGNQNLIISQLSVSGAGYSVASPQTPIVLSPGMSAPVTISFSGSPIPGTYNGTLSITSNDPFNPTFSTGLSTTIQSASVSASYPSNSATVALSNGGSIAFPESLVGSTNVQPINFLNNGTSLLTLSKLVIPSGFFVASGGNFSLSGYNTIQPGATVSLNLAINTSSVASVSGVLTMNTNDPSNPIFSINLSGSVGQGTIVLTSINPNTGASSPIVNGSTSSGLNFGIVPSSSKINATITISNPSSSSSLVIFPTSSFPSGLYPITSIPPAGLSIPPGGSIPFKVGVTASTTGQLNGTIVLSNSDPSNPSFNIAVSGFVYYWNFVTPVAPNGTTKWIMYKTTTISWNHNIGAHTLSLYLINNSSNSITTLATSHSSAAPFSFAPSGVTLGNYFVKSLLSVSSSSQFKLMNGSQLFSPVVVLSYS